MKICPNCTHEFRKDRNRIRCSYCYKVFDHDKRNQQVRKTRKRHHEGNLIYQRHYYLKIADKQCEKKRIEYATLAPEQKRKKTIQRCLRRKKQRLRDETFRIRANISRRLSIVLKAQGLTKSRVLNDYGIDAAKIYAKIGPRPSLNYDLDHIIPVTAFDFSDELQIKQAFAPENLRWLEHYENMHKSNRWVDKNGHLRRGKQRVIDLIKDEVVIEEGFGEEYLNRRQVIL